MGNMSERVDHVKPIPASLVSAAARIGGPDETLTDEQISRFVAEQLATADLDGKRVCVILSLIHI